MAVTGLVGSERPRERLEGQEGTSVWGAAIWRMASFPKAESGVGYCGSGLEFVACLQLYDLQRVTNL